MNKSQAEKVLFDVLGNYKRLSNESLFFCPACQHHKQKLSVNLDKNAFKCWVCDYRGRNIRRLVRRFGTYTQLKKWDEITGRIDYDKFAEDLFMETEKVEEQPQKLSLPEEFHTLSSRTLSLAARKPYEYLISRGLDDFDILRWKMGYCLTGEYRNRVIVPSFDDDGDVNYFISRSFIGDSYKYKNPRASKDIIFNELFVDWESDLILVEGVFDAIVAGNAVPILGSTLRADSKLIKKIVYHDTPVYLAFDEDAQKKENAVIRMLSKYDIELYKIDTTGYDDVGSMSRQIFEQRKNDASFIDGDNYLLLNMLEAI
jgi:DNA primase